MSINFTLDNPLECPICGCESLHHQTIEVFNREEDMERGFHVKINHLSMTTDTNLTGNPSKRRHGMTIEFDCEGCPHKPVLTIVQHKGATSIVFK